MPETTSTTSEPEDDSSNAASVLDFLYHDSRRVGSFLAQFEGDGHLQELTRTKTGTRGKKDSAGKGLKGDVKLFSGERKSSIDTSVDMSVGYARVFDPFWANARAFLDYLSDKQMLQIDLDTANVGQFVIASGYLSVLDLAMLKDAWKIGSLKNKILSGIADGKQFSHMTAAEKSAAKELKENTAMFIDLLQVLPHSVHASMITNEDEAKLVWCALREEYLVTPAADLTLAHGARISGEWSIVGILSAIPDYGLATPSAGEDAEPGLLQSLIGLVSQQIAPVVRVSLGRPGAAYAVTPLLIFRDVT